VLFRLIVRLTLTILRALLTCLGLGALFLFFRRSLVVAFVGRPVLFIRDRRRRDLVLLVFFLIAPRSRATR
jgi:hypothetical protein